MFVETLGEKLWPDRFERELLRLDDGGTIGLDWDGDIPDPKAKDKRPILVICPGLGGGSHNLYNLSLMWMARAAGYKCCTVLFRGGAGLPITTPVLSYSGSWRDAKFALEYVRKTYATDARSGKKDTRVYAYGVSLGANILGLYLTKEGKSATQVIDGAMLYASPWSIAKGSHFFYTNFFGLYQKIIGLMLNSTIKNE